MEQQKLNPTIVYVLALIGLLCCCIGGSGFILSGIAFYIAQNKIKEAKLNPENYDQVSIKSMNTAKIVALIILIINVLYLIITVYRISTIGWDELIQQSQEMMEQWQSQNQ
ncbi:Interferon-induced transmembrane protein [Tamlana sedimentorum]|uniref:Interferon-induced transmembrane protein n=1 Tax=Neotamlana sedimentorum TaxID=1435349 RepID=A0A0D7WC71_9FLAO|nr:CCC motif membrane protein [Tamlana sedimentorum]KJD36278.1 Interferon-induced transmembrane protein [Tamlana sedimentorum]